MTTANTITVGRLGLIPVFAAALMYYQRSVEENGPDEMFRWIAVGAFVLASISDAVDGWVARHFNQRTALGAVLDPLADKGLLLTALIALSWLDVPGLFRLPIWFVVLVLSRDIVLVVGVTVFHLHGERVAVHPHWSGKASTGLMMAALTAVLLKLPVPWSSGLVLTCGFFTIISSLVYLRRALSLLAGHSKTEDSNQSSPPKNLSS
ncbi:MAG: CDP-alcohol phosphatidyltransferase family protein [Candidatus Methylacidiphilales bacterium]